MMSNFGFMYEKLGKYEDAIKWYEKAVKGGDVNAMGYLGFVYEKLGNYEYAMKWYEKAAKSGDVGAKKNLGRLLEEYRDHNSLIFRTLALA